MKLSFITNQLCTQAEMIMDYNMTVWILARNDINFSMERA